MIPAALAMLVAAPISALLIVARGSQVTLLAGYTFCALELLAALVLWKEGSHPWQVAVSFILLGTGVGPAGTPSSHSLTGFRPPGWHGIRNRRPAKRSRRGDHTVHFGRDPGRGVRSLVRRQHRRLAPGRPEPRPHRRDHHRHSWRIA